MQYKLEMLLVYCGMLADCASIEGILVIVMRVCSVTNKKYPMILFVPRNALPKLIEVSSSPLNSTKFKVNQ